MWPRASGTPARPEQRDRLDAGAVPRLAHHLGFGCTCCRLRNRGTIHMLVKYLVYKANERSYKADLVTNCGSTKCDFKPYHHLEEAAQHAVGRNVQPPVEHLRALVDA